MAGKLSFEEKREHMKEAYKRYHQTEKYKLRSKEREDARTAKRRNDPVHKEYNRLRAKKHRENLSPEEKKREAEYNAMMHDKIRYRAHNWKKAGVKNIELAMEIWQKTEVCQICGKTTSKMHLDHDHLTGIPRGKLCSKCNQALGLVGDDPEILLRMISYLGGTHCPAIG